MNNSKQKIDSIWCDFLV